MRLVLASEPQPSLAVLSPCDANGNDKGYADTKEEEDERGDGLEHVEHHDSPPCAEEVWKDSFT